MRNYFAQRTFTEDSYLCISERLLTLKQSSRKLPQYTNGPRADYALFPIFSVRDALQLIKTDILDRKEQGEELFVISSSLGYPFDSDPDSNPISAERSFKRMWNNALGWFDDNGVAIVGAAGNSRATGREISLIPARLFRNPEMVIGSVTPDGLAHPGSQGDIGDGILTAFAPGAGARVVSSSASGVYTYEFFDPRQSAVTSYACGHAVGYVAQMLALGYSGNADIPPNRGEKPNNYAYRIVSSLAQPRVAGGPPIIHNNVPQQLYQDCGGPQGYKKRDGSCPLTNIEQPTGTAGSPASQDSAAIGAIIGAISAGIEAGQESASFTTVPLSSSTSQNSAAVDAITGAISAGVAAGQEPSSFPTSSSPTTTSDQLPATTSNAAPINSPLVPSPSPNAGIAIWLQQYSSTSGAEVDTWFAYTYTPGDPKFGNPCNRDSSGSTAVPNGTPVANELKIYPSTMSIKAYGLKLKYMSLSESGVGFLVKADTLDSVANCTPVIDAHEQTCDSLYRLTLRLTCEWSK